MLLAGLPNKNIITFSSDSVIDFFCATSGGKPCCSPPIFLVASVLMSDGITSKLFMFVSVDKIKRKAPECEREAVLASE